MLNIFKRADKSQQPVGGGKGSDFEPPKNLPELAGDIYENGYKRPSSDASSNQNASLQSAPVSSLQSTAQNTAQNTIIQNNFQNATPKSPLPSTPSFQASPASIESRSDRSSFAQQSVSSPASLKPVIEPSKNAVPRLDMSLLKQQSPQQDYAHSLYQQQSSQPISYQQPNPQHILSSGSYGLTSPNPGFSIPMRPEDALANKSIDSYGANFATIDDSTGFFKEFENYVRDNGLNNSVIDDLLDKNLLDHMVFYHNTKGGDLPFYASSAELSHAMKLKLENLQNIERTWIINRQKMDILKKLGMNMESDIHMMSEELKRLMLESKKRGINVRSSDFFQMMDNNYADKSSNTTDVSPLISPNISSNLLTATQPVVSPVIMPATSSFASSASSPVSDTTDIVHGIQNAENSEKPVPRTASLAFSPAGPSISSHPINAKFVTSKYVVGDASKYFYANSGQVFKSLSDLMEGLESMDIATFDHHVNSGKNDFSNWIKGVFGDMRLADAIRPLDSREKLWYYLRNNTL